ncbi:hypothetical protein BVG80_08330 [Sphingobacteriales bacterium TSM_CSM]|nr:hypothetical protein BVG80_08330 [Sphingobacteriales bacterium TSM_CSM]
MKNFAFFCTLVALFAVLGGTPSVAVAQTSKSRGNANSKPPVKDPKNKPKPKPSGNTDSNKTNLLKNAFSFHGGINLVTDGGSFGIDAFPNINFNPAGKRFSANAGPMYQLRQAGGSVQQVFGARANAQYRLLPGLYANAGWETTNLPNPRYTPPNVKDPNTTINPQPKRLTTNRLPLGAGFTQRLFGVNVDVCVMYDLLYRKNSSPYATPYLFRGGVFLGSGKRHKNKE